MAHVLGEECHSPGQEGQEEAETALLPVARAPSLSPVPLLAFPTLWGQTDLALQPA